ncbi:30S ribosomal protein S17 [Anaplasmataceae bacterium AB001_6]|nr:30S ribosomal protein S17 [Anaplasmataceae bacterium AB001_6]
MSSTMIGTVVNAINEKTVLVVVNRRFLHPLYKKFINKNRKYLVHDEKKFFKKGDVVKIVPSKPFSSRKTYSVVYE